MKISYDLEHLPERITRRDSEEIIALKGFLADGGMWAMEAKRRISAYFEEKLAQEICEHKVVVMM